MSFAKILLGVAVIFGCGGGVGYGSSLWPGEKQAVHSMFADMKASRVGDLVTITVNLTTTATKNQSTASSKAQTVDDGIQDLVFPPGFDNWKWYTYAGNTPRFNWSSNRSHSGGGSISNKETITTTIQARVVEINPNGVLKVEAKRNYETGKEKSDLILTGYLRQADLSSTNTISSTLVSDLQILQKGVGPLSRDQRKGWLLKLYEFLSPF